MSLALFGLCLATGPATPAHAATAEKPSFKFLRGVYLLRQISPGDHWPPVTVPRSVATHDTTNALALHPDKPFVLGQVARDLSVLSAAKDRLPLAPYYAAHAFEMLGEFMRAAKEMQEYVKNAQYRACDHLFLVRNLYKARSYQSMREAAAAWRSLDNACIEKRMTYVWGSYRAEKRHGDALASVLTDSCSTWRTRVLYEDSRREMGEGREAEAGIRKLAEENPSGSRDIYLLWNNLAAQAVYP